MSSDPPWGRLECAPAKILLTEMGKIVRLLMSSIGGLQYGAEGVHHRRSIDCSWWDRMTSWLLPVSVHNEVDRALGRGHRDVPGDDRDGPEGDF